jgi:hypothetical protein
MDWIWLVVLWDLLKPYIRIVAAKAESLDPICANHLGVSEGFQCVRVEGTHSWHALGRDVDEEVVDSHLPSWTVGSDGR